MAAPLGVMDLSLSYRELDDIQQSLQITLWKLEDEGAIDTDRYRRLDKLRRMIILAVKNFEPTGEV